MSPAIFFFVKFSIPSKPGLELTSHILYPPLSNSKSTPAISKSNAFDDSDDSHSICSFNPTPYFPALLYYLFNPTPYFPNLYLFLSLILLLIFLLLIIFYH